MVLMVSFGHSLNSVNAPFASDSSPWRIQGDALWGSFYSTRNELSRSVLKLASASLILRHPPICPPVALNTNGQLSRL